MEAHCEGPVVRTIVLGASRAHQDPAFAVRLARSIAGGSAHIGSMEAKMTVKMKHYYMGEDIDSLPRERLIEIICELGAEIESVRQSAIRSTKMMADIAKAAARGWLTMKQSDLPSSEAVMAAKDSEIERLTAERDEWKAAADTEARARREFHNKAERLTEENNRLRSIVRVNGLRWGHSHGEIDELLNQQQGDDPACGGCRGFTHFHTCSDPAKQPKV